MQFTDAVTVAGKPPVAPHHLATCLNQLGKFAWDNNIPTPIRVEWTEHDGIIHFMGTHEGRVFTIGAPKG